jgi:hypothetical protein
MIPLNLATPPTDLAVAQEKLRQANLPPPANPPATLGTSIENWTIQGASCWIVRVQDFSFPHRRHVGTFASLSAAVAFVERVEGEPEGNA